MIFTTPTFKNLTSAQWHYMEISYTEFYENKTNSLVTYARSQDRQMDVISTLATFLTSLTTPKTLWPCQ